MPPRLKSLELQGYKTFASRSEFLFAGQVTAIVGPNGSGKSNIVDALRWVLGEQSFNLLRGKRTEDMIFAGSQQRPRASMASATIVFDNSDNWLPIDFTEVAISRRAYRDGQNEYLINGQKVRLRDVNELLAQSGLAGRTYTIIGQGLVDAALALRADERRKLFEEAAGIGLYRSRRAEALRRLETTRRNLERVQDILAELRPRLRSLERQARRAREHAQIQADLRLILREWYGYHWHRRQHSLIEAQAHARQSASMRNAARREWETLGQELAARRQKLQGVRARLDSWHRQLAELHTRLQQIGRDVAVTEERMRSAEAQERQVEAEILRLEEEITRRQERLQHAEEALQTHQQAAEEARTALQQARLALQARERERVAAEKALSAARKEERTLQARRDRLQARLREREQQSKQQQQALEQARQQMAQSEEKLRQQRQRKHQAAEHARKAQAQLRHAEEAWRAHQTQIQTLEDALQQARARRSAAQAEVARLQARLEVLEQAEQALSGYTAGAQRLLEAGRKGRLKQVRGALGAQMQVPAELEQAIAAALGETLNGVLLNEAQVDAALDILLEKPSRGTLLPLDGVRPPQPISPPADPDCLGVAASLVDVPSSLRPVADLLLGNVLVVRHRAAARRLVHGVPEGSRLVTLQGEVFTPEGVVHAGLGGGSSVLSRTRERRELQQALAEAEKNLARWEQEVEVQTRVLGEMRTEAEMLQGEMRTARQGAEKATRQESEAEAAFRQAKSRLEWQQERYTQLEGELTRGQQQAAQMQAEIQRLEAEIQQAGQTIRERRLALQELPLDALQNQVAHWNTRLAVVQGSLQDAQERLEEARQGSTRLRKNRQALENRRRAFAEEQENLRLQLQALHEAEADVRAQVTEIQALIAPAETERDALEEALQNHQQAVDAAQKRLSAAEHQHAQARIRLNREEEALESLRQRIEDDFGLVEFEYEGQVSGPTPLPLDGMVEHLPVVHEIPPELEEVLKRKRAQLRRMGAVNPEAEKEYTEVQERYTFLTEQMADLQRAEADILQVVEELDTLMKEAFARTFEAVAVEFREIFRRLFGGGSARLILTDAEDLDKTGIDIEARLPGRRAQGLSLLSGGERSLTAVALVFALLKTSPTPFCILDEVDAMLDEANVVRLRDLLRELSESTQFVVITHNRNTVQAADVIYGITMGADSASQVLSLRLDEVADLTD